jgi:hypothetical protein
MLFINYFFVILKSQKKVKNIDNTYG